MTKQAEKITSTSIASYFSKNLQQLGFSSPTRALTMSCKESVENAIDALREHQIKDPTITILIQKVGEGHTKNVDRIKLRVDDNGPGIDENVIANALGSILTGSRFGRGQATLGAQGAGSTALLIYALLTTGKGCAVITKTEKMKKAMRGVIETDIEQNTGLIKGKEYLDWDRAHGLSVEYEIEAKAQINGESGLLTYLTSLALVHPFITFKYKFLDEDWQEIKRIVEYMPPLPPATKPHPQTFRLGEFIAHSHLFPDHSTERWLKTTFSRITDATIKDLKAKGIQSKLLATRVDKLTTEDIKKLYSTFQDLTIIAPSTKSVLSLGEDTLAKSIQRLGDIDFFSVVTRKPTVVDMRPVQIEIAIARFAGTAGTVEDYVKILRFANFSPLVFDKSADCVYEAIKSVNWKNYGIEQPKDSIPLGPYVIAVSIVSPSLKFVNASKTALDSGPELTEEIRSALQMAGLKLSKHIRHEDAANDLEEKRLYIEKFGPILINALCRITGAEPAQKTAAELGLRKILGRDVNEAKHEMKEAHAKVKKIKKEQAAMLKADEE
jgi:DNA topoisomerase-6 subunit B